MKRKMEELKYQKEGIKWMKKNEEIMDGGILGDDVGLGKTYQILKLIEEKRGKNLIIVPKSLINQWVNEITKMKINMKIIKIENAKTTTINEKRINKEKDVLVIVGQGQIYRRKSKYMEKSDNICKTFHDIKWTRVVIDEAHCVKNERSKIHKACKAFERKYMWLVTATPIMNKEKDFHALMSYFNIDKNECIENTEHIVNTRVLRRTKEEVGLNIDKYDNKVIEIKFETEEERRIYKEIYEDMKKEMKKENNIEVLERILRARQVSIHIEVYYEALSKQKSEPGNLVTSTKMKTFIEEIKKKPKRDKGLVFCNFLSEMRIYGKALENEGFNCRYLNGKIDIEERNKIIEEFKKEINIDNNILIMQINVGGVGLNIQEANWIYLISPSWNPCVEEQAIGRVHRKGQEKKVTVVRFIINEEEEEIKYIEKKMQEIQEKKMKDIATILK